ncbi:MAG: hypothetical protein COA78_00660 [Blastopirellula sp.]|nr:MAG: hypothetical protein COA78_00660 [Blastopirellula sp.]
MEDPGYPDARNIFGQWAANIKFIPVDEEGILVDGMLEDVDLVYVTPNRQFPTTVTMSDRRRKALLAAAEKHDFFVVEDDYECDVDYRDAPPMPLYQADQSGRVLYLGSLSKSLSPGLRLGYFVAPPEFIVEARALRGMMVRHPPVILQHTAALFISLGYYDALLLRLHKSSQRKGSVAKFLRAFVWPSFHHR